MAQDQQQTVSQRQILPRVRPELKTYEQFYDGQPYWVIKDPMALQYFRFNREEHFIIQQLRQGVTLDQLRSAHQQEFRGELLTNQDIAAFVRLLTSRGLIVLTQPDRDALLYQGRQRQWRRKLVQQFSSFMFVKIPLVDPDRLLTRMWGPLRFIWTWRFMLVYLILLLTAAAMVVLRWGEYTDMARHGFFTWRNAIYMYFAVWLVKVLHEFGHGLTCKNYGGEVHGMGFLVLVFNPFLYCDVTDAWTFPNKRHRILTTSAGMLTEIFLAAVATIVWYVTEPPGFIHAFSFNIMMVCSIVTILFNANPLLRFDGYYILMDAIEVPNLRQRSAEYMRNFFLRHILGGHTDQMAEEHRFRLVFPMYAVAAWIYRWFITIVISYTVYRILDGIHLVVVGQLLVIFLLSTMMVLPMVKFGKTIALQRAMLGISNARLVVVLAVIAVLAAVALFWPMEQHVTLNFVLEPQQSAWLRTEVAGTLQWSPAFADPQSPSSVTAQAGAVLAVVHNRQMDYDRKQILGEIEVVRIQLAHSQSRGQNHQAQILAQRQQKLQRDLDTLNDTVARAQILAPFDGEVLSPRQFVEDRRDRYLNRGEPLLLFGDRRRLTAKVWVSEKTLARIYPQRLTQAPEPIAAAELPRAELMLYGFSDVVVPGRVAGMPSDQCQDNMGEFGEKMALSNKVGGEVITEFDPLLNTEKPAEPVYEVAIELDPQSLPSAVRPYMSGRVRIYCGKSTLFQWGRDSLLRFISPEVRL